MSLREEKLSGHVNQGITQEMIDAMSDEDVTPMTNEEVEAYIAELEQELGMSRVEFLERVHARTEPDTFAAMALKTFLLY